MTYFVYMLITISKNKKKTYVGYTNNLTQRLKKHNSNKGAKSTKGHNWKLIYSKTFNSKSKALSYEYYLKKNRIKTHNSGKGAKFTRGKIWKLAYFRKYYSKIKAMKEEYKLKKNYKLRNMIKYNFLN